MEPDNTPDYLITEFQLVNVTKPFSDLITKLDVLVNLQKKMLNSKLADQNMPHKKNSFDMSFRRMDNE